jgi:hypothetical protein
MSPLPSWTFVSFVVCALDFPLLTFSPQAVNPISFYPQRVFQPIGWFRAEI